MAKNTKTPAGWDYILGDSSVMGMAKAILNNLMMTDGMAEIHNQDEQCFSWDGHRYMPASSVLLENALWRTLDKCSVTIFDKGRPSGTNPCHPTGRTITDVRRALKAAAPHRDPIEYAPAWLRKSDIPANEVFPMKNGLLHMRTGTFLAHTPAFFNRWHTSVEYNASAECPLWMEFVRSAHEERQDCIDLHQEIFGYYLMSGTFMHKFAIFHGLPGTGRSVIMKTLRSMIGLGGFVEMNMAQIGNTKDSHAMASAENRAVLGIFDARIGPEANNAAMMEILLKLPVGDGVPIRRNLLGGGDSHATCYAKPILATNKFLRLPDPAIIGRRLMVIMNRQFRNTPEEIKGLDTKLLVELPGIVNWSLEGAKRLLARGEFIQCDYGLDVVEITDERADPFGEFISMYLDIDPDGRVSVTDLHQVYNRMHRRVENLERQTKGRYIVEQLIEALGTNVVRRIKKTRFKDFWGRDEQGTALTGVCIKPEVIDAFLANNPNPPKQTSFGG